MSNKTKKPDLDRKRGQKKVKETIKMELVAVVLTLFDLLILCCCCNSHLNSQKMDSKGKQIGMVMGRVVVKKEITDEGYEQNQRESVENEFFESNKKKKVAVTGGGGGGTRVPSSGGGGMRCCQVEKCTTDLTDAKQYHRRHKVCEHHAKAQVVLVAGIRQRFCQQCSRFHELSEFDETKRSCRRRLAGHNERRRKNAAESHVEGSSRKANGNHGTRLKDMVCGQVDERGRIKITIQENATYKHFQIS